MLSNMARSVGGLARILPPQNKPQTHKKTQTLTTYTITTKQEHSETRLARFVLSLSHMTTAMASQHQIDAMTHKLEQIIQGKGKIMLVLTRKKGETIQIGDDIVIKVISTGRGKVKIGIEAPNSVRVIRGELVQQLTERKEVPEATVAHA